MYNIHCQAKKIILLSVFLILMTALLSGCRIHVNINKKSFSVEEMIADKALSADPVKYNADGSYTVTFRYDKGGFKKMDLSQAYVAYYPFTVLEQIDTIVGEDTEDIPPLPIDAQNAINEVTGENQLEKIAVIIVETLDDNTLSVSFTDKDDPVSGKEYFFIIPNAGLAGSVIPE